MLTLFKSKPVVDEDFNKALQRAMNKRVTTIAAYRPTHTRRRIDRRKMSRHPSDKAAMISFSENGKLRRVRCAVSNFSALGLGLELKTSIALPTRFQLDAPDLGLTGRAIKNWEDQGRCGVAFENAQKITRITD